jgi:hypothetical protein
LHIHKISSLLTYAGAQSVETGITGET